MNNLKINNEIYIDEIGKYHSHKNKVSKPKRELTNEEISQLSDEEFDEMFRGMEAPGENMESKQNRAIENLYDSME